MADRPPPGFRSIYEADPEPTPQIPGILAGGVNPPSPAIPTGGGPPDMRDFWTRQTATTAQGLRKVLPGSVADILAEGIVPQSDADALVYLATLPYPGARTEVSGAVKGVETLGSKALGRVMDASPMIRKGISTLLAGAVGGSIDPNSTAWSGALRGAFALGAQGVIDRVTKLASYTPWLQRIAKADRENVGKTLGEMVPEIGQIKSLKDFQSAFLHRYGNDKIKAAYGKVIDEIGNDLGNQGVRSMSYLAELQTDPKAQVGRLALPKNVQEGFNFREVINKVQSLRDNARKMAGTHPVDANALFKRANNIESEVLTSIPEGAREKYLGIKRMYGRWQSMLDFMKDPKLITNDGLNMQKLQEKFRSEGLSASEALISSAEVAKFQESLFRGTPDPNSLLTDFTPDPATHGRAHFMGMTVSLPGLFKSEREFVGNVPDRPGRFFIKNAPVLGGRIPSLTEYLAGKRPDVDERQDRPPITLTTPTGE